MARKTFNKEYKISAVKLVLEESYEPKQAARLLNIHPQTLYSWVTEYKECGENAFPGKGNSKYHDHYKLRVLEKENNTLKEEIRLLKKYRAFLKKGKN
jgi:Transposase and inactivated derivatives